MIFLSKSRVRPVVATGFFAYRSLQVEISIDQKTRRHSTDALTGYYRLVAEIATGIHSVFVLNWSTFEQNCSNQWVYRQ